MTCHDTPCHALQLDFRDEAENLRRFGRCFGSSFWRAIVSFPRPVDDLVSQHVVVETFELGESVAEYYARRASNLRGLTCSNRSCRWLACE